MSNLTVVSITPPKVPNDLSRQLRELADSIDSGEVSSLVVSLVRNDHYELMLGASLQDSLVLASLLHDSVLRKFRND